MTTPTQHDPSQRWIDKALALAPTVPILLNSLKSIEPLVEQYWVLRQSKVLPVRLMTPADLVQ